MSRIDYIRLVFDLLKSHPGSFNQEFEELNGTPIDNENGILRRIRFYIELSDGNHCFDVFQEELDGASTYYMHDVTDPDERIAISPNRARSLFFIVKKEYRS